MAKSSLQLAGAHVLREVIDQGRSLDQALTDQSRPVRPEESAALQEIGYGGCRHYQYLDGLIGKLLAKPIRKKDRMVHFLLVVGLYQINFMRVPDHAAVNQAVAALAASRQSWARGLVNGVLRSFIRARDGDQLIALESSLTPAQQASLPEHVYEWIRQSWPDHAKTVYNGLQERPPLTLRVNQQKTTPAEYLDLLAAQEITATTTAESPWGIVLDKPMAVHDIPLFAEGWASVQDESAQLCTLAMDLAPGQQVLDACAAPGGKTGAMLEFEPGIRLTAVDLPDRSEGIHENLRRIGLQADVLENGLEALAGEWDGDPLDRILLDAPCSGTGVIRRHPDIRHRRRPGDLARFAEQQGRLLDIAWEMLAGGGKLLYVTCSIMPVENDAVIEAFLARHGDAIVEVPGNIQGIATPHGIQRLPGVHDGDGFYYCRLGKL